MKRKPPVPDGETEPFYVAIMLDFETDERDRVLWVMSDNFVAALKATRIVQPALQQSALKEEK